MRFKMSPSIYFSLFCSLSVLSVNFACQNKKEASSLVDETTVTATHPVFHKGVGGPIDSATANRWKRNLAQTLSRRTPAANTTSVFYLPTAALRNLIAADKVAGVCFYFGKDSTGNVHLMPVGVHVTGHVVKTEVVVTNNGPVSWLIAKQWQLDYRQRHPNSIWGHFSGSIAVNRLLENGSDTVRIALGMSDEGIQQMIFSDAAITESEVEFDRTRPVPVSPSSSVNYME